MAAAMKEQDKGTRRRNFLIRVTAGVGLAIGSPSLARQALAAEEPQAADKKRRSRYQQDSTEVQDFYRVNRYPPKRGRSSC
jgi:hypothetical protein